MLIHCESVVLLQDRPSSNLATAVATVWTETVGMLLLAPDIQEELLYLPEVLHGKAAKHERLLKPLDWRVQRRMWGRIKKRQ